MEKVYQSLGRESCSVKPPIRHDRRYRQNYALLGSDGAEVEQRNGKHDARRLHGGSFGKGSQAGRAGRSLRVRLSRFTHVYRFFQLQLQLLAGTIDRLRRLGG